MNKVVEWIEEFIRSQSTKASTKIGIVLLVLFLVFYVDYLTGFSYNYNQGHRIANIGKVREIMKGNELDSLSLRRLQLIEKDILNHSPLFSLSSWSFLYTDVTSHQKPKEIEPKNTNTPIASKNSSASGVKHNNNRLWHFVSSSWVLLLTSLTVIILVFFDRNQPLSIRISVLTLIETFIFLSAALFSYLFDFIPVINEDKIYLNYILNAFLHGLIMFLIWIMFMNKPIGA